MLGHNSTITVLEVISPLTYSFQQLTSHMAGACAREGVPLHALEYSLPKTNGTIDNLTIWGWVFDEAVPVRGNVLGEAVS